MSVNRLIIATLVSTSCCGASAEENNLSANIYGFAMADGIYDAKRVDPNWNDTLRVSTISTQKPNPYGADGEFVFSVRQSRLGVKGDYGKDIHFILEAELFGVGADEGQTTPRLRHAWAEYKNFGMGQYWSNFMDADVFPNTIDYWGPTGMVFYRNMQARYTFELQEDELALSLENPGTALTTGQFRDTDGCELPNAIDSCGSTAADIFRSHNDIPDFVARYRNNGEFGHWQLAGIVRKLGYERLDNNTSDSKLGWGLNASSVLNTGNQNKIKLQAVYGEGYGNYLNDGGVDIAPSSQDLNTAKADTVPILGVVAYYDHYWNQYWSSSIGYSFTDVHTLDGQASDEFQKGEIAQVNLLHHPAENVTLGTEFIWGKRTDISGDTGTDYRIQFSLKVNFDTGNLLK